jgi:hypothetical protein
MAHAITPTDRREAPRCCECSATLRIVEPFTGGVAQHHRCGHCGVHLRVRRVSASAWQVRTAAEASGQRTAPLPAIAPIALREKLCRVCRFIEQQLQPRDGVEPGMADAAEADAR